MFTLTKFHPFDLFCRPSLWNENSDDFWDQQSRIIEKAFYTRSRWSLNEKTNKYELELDVPGHSSSDLTVETTPEGTLKISGSSKKRAFSSSYNLPADGDIKTLEASAKDGILTITVSKIVPVNNTKKIEIKNGD